MSHSPTAFFLAPLSFSFLSHTSRHFIFFSRCISNWEFFGEKIVNNCKFTSSCSYCCWCSYCCYSCYYKDGKVCWLPYPQAVHKTDFFLAWLTFHFFWPFSIVCVKHIFWLCFPSSRLIPSVLRCRRRRLPPSSG